MKYLLTFLFLALPVFAYAQTVTLTPSKANVSVGETFQLSIQFDTGAESINAADGTILIPDGTEVVSVSTGGSAFTLWPVQPTANASTRSIAFTGGTPGGLAPHTHATLFTVTLKALKQGTYTLSSNNISFYKNDGKGTVVAVVDASNSVSVNSSPSTSTTREPRDSTPPQFAYADIGKDATLFNGAWYLSFSANDNGNATPTCQVKEGIFSKFVAADRYYVLRDQSRSSFITIKATDGAGNSSTKLLWPAHIPHIAYGIGILLLLIALGYGVFKVRIL